MFWFINLLVIGLGIFLIGGIVYLALMVIDQYKDYVNLSVKESSLRIFNLLPEKYEKEIQVLEREFEDAKSRYKHYKELIKSLFLKAVVPVSVVWLVLLCVSMFGLYG